MIDTDPQILPRSHRLQQQLLQQLASRARRRHPCRINDHRRHSSRRTTSRRKPPRTARTIHNDRPGIATPAQCAPGTCRNSARGRAVVRAGQRDCVQRLCGARTPRLVTGDRGDRRGRVEGRGVPADSGEQCARRQLLRVVQPGEPQCRLKSVKEWLTGRAAWYIPKRPGRRWTSFRVCCKCPLWQEQSTEVAM